MKYITIIFSVVLTLTVSSSALADSQNINPELKILTTATGWVNQSGSIAEFEFKLSPTQPDTYILSGTYTNNAKGFQCQKIKYPLSGYYYVGTQTISFSVAWSNSSEDCHSVTGWTGYFDFAQLPTQLITNWNLAYGTFAGHSILQGNDTFTWN